MMNHEITLIGRSIEIPPDQNIKDRSKRIRITNNCSRSSSGSRTTSIIYTVLHFLPARSVNTATLAAHLYSTHGS